MYITLTASYRVRCGEPFIISWLFSGPSPTGGWAVSLLGGCVEDRAKAGSILICEGYPGMREAFSLMLSGCYELRFVTEPGQIPTEFRRQPYRLVIWDMDSTDGALETLKFIRRLAPDVKILLVSGEFDLDFQTNAIKECGGVRFETKPWASTKALQERIQVILGDKESSIKRWELRVPIESSAQVLNAMPGHGRLSR